MTSISRRVAPRATGAVGRSFTRGPNGQRDATPRRRPAILLVEDDDHLREAMTAELESLGFGVIPASNGAGALALLRSGTRPFLILLDLMMPVMDGWGFRAAQLADASLAPIPVVLLSARGDADRQGRSLGVAAALSKPVDLDQLHGLLRRYAPGGDMPAQG